MDLRVLQYFLTVAQEGNITKAAALLHISQPSVSRQLMLLEEELGVSLFHRSNHSIVLTEDGLLFQRRARELLELAEKTKRELRPDAALSGIVSIGSGEFRSSQLLSRMMAVFRQEHPMVHFDFYSGNSDNIIQRIQQGILDIGLLLEPPELSKYAFLRLPVTERWGVLVREDFPLAQKSAVTPSDLEGLPLLLTNRGTIRGELLNWLGSYANEANFVIGGNLPYNLAMLAQQGAGAFVNLELPCRYDGLRFLPLSPSLEARTVLAWKKAQPYSRATEAFLEFVKKYAKRISDHSI